MSTKPTEKLTKEITSVKLARELLIEEIQAHAGDLADLSDAIDCIDDLIDNTEMEVRIQKNAEISAMAERI